MTDIVERLRSQSGLPGYYEPPAIQIDAADEIVRLLEIISIAMESIDADDVIGAYEKLAKAKDATP